MQAAAIAPPYVLVGHSLGGVIVLSFADRYRAEVAGMVLVDPGHPQTFPRIAAAIAPASVYDKLLAQAAHSLLTHSRQWSWLKAWGIRVAQRRGMRRAIVAVARRLAVILHRMWVDESEFRWRRDNAAGSCSFPKIPGGERRKTAVNEITRSASAEKCPHGDDGWGEFVRLSLLPLISGEGAVKIVTSPSFSSHHEAA